MTIQSPHQTKAATEIAQLKAELASETAALRASEKRVRDSRANVISLERELADVAKKLNKYKRLGLFFGSPMVALLLPVVVPAIFLSRAQKRRGVLKARELSLQLTPADIAEEATPQEVVEQKAPPEPVRMPEIVDPKIYSAKLLSGTLPEKGDILHPELVSLVVTNFNNADYLQVALLSSLAQKYVEVEVILVDDGSSDNSVEIAQELAAKYENLRVVPLLKNFGCYYARNMGLAAAKGDYITFLDSDDLIVPDRVAIQLDAIKAKPGAIASMCRARRWNEDYSDAISQVKIVENTLLFAQRVRDEIGYYDTVKFAADSEYRARIEAAFGPRVVTRHDEEVYFLRTVEDSLALASTSAAYSLTDAGLEVSLSPVRKQYALSYRKWHENNQRNFAELYMPFPQRARKFSIGSKKQNASPALGERIIGTMASFPERQDMMRNAVQSILPQVDELRLYLNDYVAVPKFLDDPKIHVTLGVSAAGDLRDNGKFYSVNDVDGYVLTFDDDIIYPQDYVAKMVHHIDVFDRKAVVGVHGVIYPKEKLGYIENREVLMFKGEHKGRFVDLIGTGTAAFHTSSFRPQLVKFETKGICDLWFALQCHEENLPIVAIPRARNWLAEQAFEESNTRLWNEAVTHKERNNKLYHAKLYPHIKNGNGRNKHERNAVAKYGTNTLELAGIQMVYAP